MCGPVMCGPVMCGPVARTRRTTLRMMSRLVFADPDDLGADGAVIVLGGENLPGTLAGAMVADRYVVLRPGITVRVLAPRPSA